MRPTPLEHKIGDTLSLKSLVLRPHYGPTQHPIKLPPQELLDVIDPFFDKVQLKLDKSLNPFGLITIQQLNKELEEFFFTFGSNPKIECLDFLVGVDGQYPALSALSLHESRKDDPDCGPFHNSCIFWRNHDRNLCKSVRTYSFEKVCKFE